MASKLVRNSSTCSSSSKSPGTSIQWECHRPSSREMLVWKRSTGSYQLTIVDDWFFEPEVGQRREVLDVVLLGQLLVVDLDEVDAETIRVIVDVLQFGQHFVTVTTVASICNNNNSTKWSRQYSTPIGRSIITAQSVLIINNVRKMHRRPITTSRVHVRYRRRLRWCWYLKMDIFSYVVRLSPQLVPIN